MSQAFRSRVEEEGVSDFPCNISLFLVVKILLFHMEFEFLFVINSFRCFAIILPNEHPIWRVRRRWETSREVVIYRWFRLLQLDISSICSRLLRAPVTGTNERTGTWLSCSLLDDRMNKCCALQFTVQSIFCAAHPFDCIFHISLHKRIETIFCKMQINSVLWTFEMQSNWADYELRILRRRLQRELQVRKPYQTVFEA